MDSAALGASSARPTGHSRGLGTAASIVGAARWRISPPSEIQRFLIWMQSLMPNPWGKYDMMKSFSRQNNTWRLAQGPILHVPIARLWFYSHRAPLYKLAAQRSKIFFLWKFGDSRNLWILSDQWSEFCFPNFLFRLSLIIIKWSSELSTKKI